MTTKQAFKLIPEKSYIRFAKGKYRVASVKNLFGALMIEIYDEPPSYHTDLVNADSCGMIRTKKP